MLTGAFLTGLSAQAIGRPGWGGALIVVHGAIGLSLLVIAPWKTRVAQKGLARRNPKRVLSLVLAGLAVVVLVTGIAHTVGYPRHLGPFTVLWVHVATALALLPLLAWHFLARNTVPRQTDLSRRNLLRLGGLASAGGLLWLGFDRSINLAELRGSSRRFSGSHERSSFEPQGIPVTSWLDDTTPAIDAATWRLAIGQASGRKLITLDDLNRLAAEEVTADLDCTSGWYTRQLWKGVRLEHIIDAATLDERDRSIAVWSETGYARRFPLGDLDRLWLVTEVGGAALSAGHGFPARLIAADRRGFWWVKWVVRVETSSVPWWVQLPYPAT